jgi:hypothetical protein
MGAGRRALLVTALALASWAADAKDRKQERAKLLTRSIYVPLEVKLCEHLQNAVLYQDEAAVGLLPAKRIFQFTYYPELSRIEPQKTDLRAEGRRTDGSGFVGRFAVTPWGVFTASHKIALDMEKQIEKMRFKLDVRYPPVGLTLRCADSCGRSATGFAAAVAHGSPLEQ